MAKKVKIVVRWVPELEPVIIDGQYPIQKFRTMEESDALIANAIDAMKLERAEERALEAVEDSFYPEN